jgi:hypothetical protein
VFTWRVYNDDCVINRVVLSIQARKQLRIVPAYVALKLAAWVEVVETTGLESVRKVAKHDY